MIRMTYYDKAFLLMWHVAKFRGICPLAVIYPFYGSLCEAANMSSLLELVINAKL